MPNKPLIKASPQMQAADYESRLMMARDTFRELQTHIQSADQKVQFVLTANAFLAASVSFEGRNALARIQAQGLTTISSLALIGSGMILLGIIASTVFTVLTLVPRVTLQSRRSVFFFSDVAATPADAYVSEFMTLSGEELYRQVIYQVHSNARIVEVKFMWARRATLALAATLFVWVFIQAVQFLS